MDSGAFSEVRFSAKTKKLEVVAPITPKEWRRRLSIYLRLGRALASRLTVVAPDRVGDQDETLQRLAQYRPELLDLHQLGVHILIPLQVGSRSHETFYAEAKSVAGVPLDPAFTMKKAATSQAAAEEFLRSARPSRLHLLGMGPNNIRAGQITAMIRRISPSTEISMDSNRLRAVTGERRPMTITERSLRESEATNLFGEVESSVLNPLGIRLDYTDAIASPSTWASSESLREVASSSGLNLSEIHAFLNNPDAFLGRSLPDSECLYWEQPMMANALDQAWRKYVEQLHLSCVRTAAIQLTFRTEAA